MNFRGQGTLKKSLVISMTLLVFGIRQGYSNDAPISTLGTVTSSGNTAGVPINATNFNNVGSCGLEIHYDPAIASATSVVLGPGITGGINANFSTPGVIIIGWYTYPALTLPGNPLIFTVYFARVNSGTTPVSWFDNGMSCYWADGNYQTLNDIPTSTFYIDGSLTFSSSVAADFSADNLAPPKNTTVTFTDLSTGSPTNWAWSFNRPSVVYVSGTTSTSQNPKVQFTEGGLYTVTLTASKTGNTDTEIKVDYIRAGTPGVWTGATSSDWGTNTNWENWLVPLSTTAVVIPSAAANWPEYAGDFTIGTTCLSVTMNGSSQATIGGNFTINAGSGLTIVNDAEFRVAGNWTNAGAFSAGTGTVDFTGTSPASIISAGSPAVINDFYHLKISKVGATLTLPPGLLVNVNGNLLINP